MYMEFDKKQIDYLNQKEKQKRNKETWYDEEAKLCIIELAKAWAITSPDGSDTYPFLTPFCKYEHLTRFKDQLDAVANMVQQAEPTKAEIEAWRKEQEAKLETGMRQNYPKYVYGYEESRIAQEYLRSKISFFWQDTLIAAAERQGLKSPVFQDEDSNTFLEEYRDTEGFDVINIRPRRKKFPPETSVVF